FVRVLPPHRRFERRDSLSRLPPRPLLHLLPASPFLSRPPLSPVANPAVQSPPRESAILHAACFPAFARPCAFSALPLQLRVLRFRRPAQCSSNAVASPCCLARSQPCLVGRRAIPAPPARAETPSSLRFAPAFSALQLLSPRALHPLRKLRGSARVFLP